MGLPDDGLPTRIPGRPRPVSLLEVCRARLLELLPLVFVLLLGDVASMIAFYHTRCSVLTSSDEMGFAGVVRGVVVGNDVPDLLALLVWSQRSSA